MLVDGGLIVGYLTAALVRGGHRLADRTVDSLLDRLTNLVANRMGRGPVDRLRQHPREETVQREVGLTIDGATSVDANFAHELATLIAELDRNGGRQMINEVYAQMNVQAFDHGTAIGSVHATGGTGGSALGAGHAGGGGAVAYGPGSVAEGGKGGGPALTAFELLARASLGMGYTLDEFIQLAGFDPDGPELDMIGRGGDGGFATDDIERPGEDGGSGLVVITSLSDRGTKMQVDVFRADGKSTIRPKLGLEDAGGGAA
jgi:hypothetical protein